MITRYTLNPFSEMQRLQNEMNRLFSSYNGYEENFPAINLRANKEEAYLTAEIPGMEPDELNINVNNNELTIEGKKQEVNAGEEAIFQRNERGAGNFSRTVKLPFDVDNEKVTAKYKNGVLQLYLPRTEASKPRKITVNKE